MKNPEGAFLRDFMILKMVNRKNLPSHWYNAFNKVERPIQQAHTTARTVGKFRMAIQNQRGGVVLRDMSIIYSNKAKHAIIILAISRRRTVFVGHNKITAQSVNARIDADFSRCFNT